MTKTEIPLGFLPFSRGVGQPLAPSADRCELKGHLSARSRFSPFLDGIARYFSNANDEETDKMYRFEIEELAAESVRSELAKMRQAQMDCAPFMGGLNSGVAFDSAEGLYRQVLTDACGLPEQDVRHLSINSLRILLKSRPEPGSQAWRDAPAMAFDSGEKSVLDDILA